jgi:hypothetical protein
MKTSKETSDMLMNPTLRKLLEWIEAVNSYQAKESFFTCIDHYADSLERWKVEFIEACGKSKVHQGDMITVATYGDDVILISDQRSGEFIKLTLAGKEVTSV